MSQATVWGVPRNAGEAGTPFSKDNYAARADEAFDALLSAHKGSTRPSYAVAGTIWIDSTGTPWIVNLFDGSNDIPIGIADTTGGYFLSNTRRPEKVKTADYTVTTADSGFAIVMNKATAVTVTLPALASHKSEAYFIRNIGVGTVTIDPNASETIEGTATQALATGESTTIWPSSTTDWRAETVAPASTSAPPTLQVFTANGTWTKPAGCKTIKVTVVGGGGGGGGGGSASGGYGGGGGGGGGASVDYVDVSAISSETVTIGAAGAAGAAAGNGGAGGTTSFGAHASATGGSGGVTQGDGGAGGTGSTGSINYTGAKGDGITIFTASSSSGPSGGGGGNSLHGFGGGAGHYDGAGSAGGGFGGGGSGPGSTWASAGAGGAGAVGIVIVEEYY